MKNHAINASRKEIIADSEKIFSNKQKTPAENHRSHRSLGIVQSLEITQFKHLFALGRQGFYRLIDLFHDFVLINSFRSTLGRVVTLPQIETSILYKDSTYPHYYLCNYLPLSAGKDTLSYSLLKFKRGLQPDLNAWISCSLEMLAPLIPPGRTILRALHHDETAVREENPTSLDKLGKTLALHLQGRYTPRLLRKFRVIPPIKQLSREERTAGLKDLYSAAPSITPYSQSSNALSHQSPQPSNTHSPQPSFLIIDDILTTGATMKTIIGSLLKVYPGAGLDIFTLARADYDTRLTQPPSLPGKTYPTREDMNFTVAEEEPPAYSLQELQIWIRTNTF
jgi:predicted amidophosphoribosyltransferase